MNKLKNSLLFLTLSSVLACIPAHTQENKRDYKAELNLELDAKRKEVCEQTYLAPRTFYLTSRSSGVFNDYARSFDRLLYPKLRKASFAGSGYVTFAITIASTGALKSFNIYSSNGSQELNELVKRSVESGAPYTSFSSKMKAVADEIFFVRTVTSKGFRIPATSESRLSDGEVRASIEQVKELTELNNKLYREVCGSPN